MKIQYSVDPRGAQSPVVCCKRTRCVIGPAAVEHDESFFHFPSSERRKNCSRIAKKTVEILFRANDKRDGISVHIFMFVNGIYRNEIRNIQRSVIRANVLRVCDK